MRFAVCRLSGPQPAPNFFALGNLPVTGALSSPSSCSCRRKSRLLLVHCEPNVVVCPLPATAPSLHPNFLLYTWLACEMDKVTPSCCLVRDLELHCPLVYYRSALAPFSLSVCPILFKLYSNQYMYKYCPRPKHSSTNTRVNSSAALQSIQWHQ